MATSTRVREFIRANVVGLLALYVALGGVGWAASTIDSSDIKRNAVRAKHIQDGAVTNPKLAAGAVDSGKVADGSLNGADIATSGIGAGNLASGAVTGPKLADGAVDSGKVLDGSLTAADLDTAQVQRRVTGTCSSGQAVAAVAQDGAVSCVGTGGPPSGSAGGDLTGSYPNPQLGAGAVNSAKVLDNSLTGADILNGTLVGGDIAANQITGAHIADAQVATADLANSVVTNAKLAPSAVGSAQVADNSLTGVDVDESTLGRVPSAQTANEAGIVVGYDHGLQAPSDPETVIIAVNGLSIGARCFFNAGNGVSIGVYAKSSAAGATLSFGGVGGANGPTPGGAFQNGLALTGTYQLLRTDAAPPASAGQGHTVVAQLIYNGGSAGMVSVQLYFSASADQTCHAEGVALPAA